MTSAIITAQHYLNDEIVAAKLAASDFMVLVSPAFEVEGQSVQVILDGNHSFAAALEAGVEPEIVEATLAQNDTIGQLKAGDIDTFLTLNRIDGDYLDARTRKDFW